MLVCAFVVLVSRLKRDAFAASHLCDSLLQAVADPYIGRTDKGHQAEPKGGIINRTCPVVSVRSKQTSNSDAPLDGLERLVKAEHRLHLQAVVLARLVIRIVVEEVFLWRFVLADVAAAKLVDALNFLRVSASSLVEAWWLLLTLPDHSVACLIARCLQRGVILADF